VTDLLSGCRYPPGEPVVLGAWDVRLFRGELVPGAGPQL
jgi:hypothetical protein